MTDTKEIKLTTLEKQVSAFIKMWEEMRRYDAEYDRNWNSGARRKSNEMKPKIDRLVKGIKSKQIPML